MLGSMVGKYFTWEWGPTGGLGMITFPSQKIEGDNLRTSEFVSYVTASTNPKPI